MLKYIKNLYQQFFCQYKPKNDKSGKKIPIDDSITKVLVYFKKEFHSSADLTIRNITVSDTNVALFTMEGMVDKNVLSESIVQPIIKHHLNTTKSATEKYIEIRDSVIESVEQVEVSTYDDAFSFLMSGFALLFVDGNPCILAIGVQGFSFRSISEPSGEMTQIGPREGFAEPMRINMTLIRRRMKTPNLKFETMKVGSQSHTDICLCYLTNVVSETILKEVRKRIYEIDIKNVLASGYISPFLEEKQNVAIFSSIGITERPDTVCGKISEGRIAILVDGTPNALIVPYLFSEYFQAVDDYSVRPYFATITRWIKYFAFFLAIILPGLYVAVGSFNPEILPQELITKVAKSITTTPLPLAIETLLTHVIYEIMREAGLRLPKALGHAVSIVGALVIGESAVNAGLMGAPTLMVVALAAISSYVIPSLYEPISFLRILFIIVGGLFGMWGITLLFCAVLINICSKNNFGIPFSAPISPFKFSCMRDVLVRTSWKVLSKRDDPIQTMPGSEIK